MQSKSNHIHDKTDTFKEEKEGTTNKTGRFVKEVVNNDSTSGNNAYKAEETSQKDAKKTGQSAPQSQNGGRMQEKPLEPSGKSVSVPTDRIVKTSSSHEGSHQTSPSTQSEKSSHYGMQTVEESGRGHDLSNEKDLLNPKLKKDKVDTAELPGRIRKEEK